MPRGAVTVRPTDRDLSRLAKLLRRYGGDRTSVTRLAWGHLLATIERGEPVHVIVPSEQVPDEPKPAPE